MSPEITLRVNGESYGGWQSIDIQLSMATIAGSFSLTLTERWADQFLAWPVRPGESCEVVMGNDVIITGYIDDVAPRYDREQHSIRVSGRDKTADLVDCSVQHEGGQWTHRTLLQLARDVVAPFGISVSALDDTGPAFRVRKIQEGESVFEFLERAARTRGVRLQTTGKGDLLIARPLNLMAFDALVLGENIEAAQGRFSHRDRHSEYIVKGTMAGTDFGFGEAVIERVGSAEDPRITRHRPLVIPAEDQVDNAEAKTRAEWERNVRFGRSLEVTYTVSDWTQSNGDRWQHSDQVHVTDEFNGLDEVLVISAVRYVLDDEGRHTDLTVTRPEAFDVIAIPEPTENTASGFASL